MLVLTEVQSQDRKHPNLRSELQQMARGQKYVMSMYLLVIYHEFNLDDSMAFD